MFRCVTEILLIKVLEPIIYTYKLTSLSSPVTVRYFRGGAEGSHLWEREESGRNTKCLERDTGLFAVCYKVNHFSGSDVYMTVTHENSQSHCPS